MRHLKSVDGCFEFAVRAMGVSCLTFASARIIPGVKAMVMLFFPTVLTQWIFG